MKRYGSPELVDLIQPTILEYEKHIKDPFQLGARIAIPQEVLRTSRDPVGPFRDATSTLAHRTGIKLVHAIAQAGGIATVRLQLDEWRDWDFQAHVLRLNTDVQPAEVFQPIVEMKEPVPHFVYYPADWLCVYCGALMDGLKQPRKCSQCGGPKWITWKEREAWRR